MRRTTAGQLWGLALLWGLLVLRRHWEAPVMASMQRLRTALSVPLQPTGLPEAATRMWKRAHPFPPPRSANPASPAAAPPRHMWMCPVNVTDSLSTPLYGPFAACQFVPATACERPGFLAEDYCACSCWLRRRKKSGGGGIPSADGSGPPISPPPPPPPPPSQPLWWIRGVPYALADFVERHPGGYRFLANSVDTDITYLFESHHMGKGLQRAMGILEAHRYEGYVNGTMMNHRPGIDQFWAQLDAEERLLFDHVLGGRHGVSKLLSSERYHRLREEIASTFDYSNDLKEPTLSYHVLQAGVILFFLWLLFGRCLRDCDTAVFTVGATVNHILLGMCVAWLGGMAHNGLHVFHRRRLETGFMLSWFYNPFRWISSHVQSHHMWTNTPYDADWNNLADLQILWHDDLAPGGLAASRLQYLAFFVAGAIRWTLSDAAAALSAPFQVYPSATGLELWSPLLIPAILLLTGGGRRGMGYRRWLPRMALTSTVTMLYVSALFLMSHFQNGFENGSGGGSEGGNVTGGSFGITDGKALYLSENMDDWGELQLLTTVGWARHWTAAPSTASLLSSLVSMVSLYLDLQPAHHLFPAVHHSKLPKILPLLEKHYPEIATERPFLEVVRGCARTITDKVHPRMVESGL